MELQADGRLDDTTLGGTDSAAAIDGLPRTTVPTTTMVAVRDFDDQEGARRLGQMVGVVVNAIGSFIDLSRLDGVMVAIDYDGALAALDRGMNGLTRLIREAWRIRPRSGSRALALGF